MNHRTSAHDLRGMFRAAKRRRRKHDRSGDMNAYWIEHRRLCSLFRELADRGLGLRR